MDVRHALRRVFGGGADTTALNPVNTRDNHAVGDPLTTRDNHAVGDPLPVTGGGNVPVPNRNAWAHGQQRCAVPGTAVQLPNVPVPDGFALAIRAIPGNTDNIFLGNSQANAQNPALRLTFARGTGPSLYITNANLVWLDAVVVGEGIDYWVEQ